MTPAASCSNAWRRKSRGICGIFNRSIVRSWREEHEWLKREPAHLPVSRKIAQELFPQKDLLRFQVSEETSEVEALKIAMDLERRAHDFFKEFAGQLTSSERKTFLAFAEEEQSHLDALMDEYNTIMRR
jgi:hypothetical protein